VLSRWAAGLPPEVIAPVVGLLTGVAVYVDPEQLRHPSRTAPGKGEPMHLISSYGTGAILAGALGAHALITAVLIALVVAIIVGAILYLLHPTRAYAGAAAVVVFLVLLLLELV
jgi:hypothetical protein